jgi:acetyl-CoA synthetase
MTDTTDKVPIHPVAPRLKEGPKQPHIGPDIHAYQSAHKETVGHESDKWWAKVNFSAIACMGIGNDCLCDLAS